MEVRKKERSADHLDILDNKDSFCKGHRFDTWGKPPLYSFQCMYPVCLGSMSDIEWAQINAFDRSLLMSYVSGREHSPIR